MSEEKGKQAPKNTVKRLLRIPLVRILGLAVLIVLLIVAIAVVLGGVKKRDVKTAQEDYVLSAGPGELIDMQAFDGGIAVLQSNALSYVDDLGVGISENEHAYANPVLRTAGRRALLFDRGGNLLRLEKNAETLRELPLDAAITTADLCGNGTYAYVLNAHEGYQSHFFVYDEKDEKLFEWGSATDYVTLARLSKNGKKAILVSFVAENAEFSSKVTAFDFGASDPIFSVELQKTTVFAVKFLSGSSVAVFADNGVYRLNRKGEVETIQAYSPTEINCAAVSNADLNALSLNLYGNEHNAQIILYNRGLREIGKYEGGSTVTGLTSDNRHIAVVSGNQVQILSKNSAARTISLEEICTKCVLRRNSVFVLTPGGVRLYSIFGSDTGNAFLKKTEQ